MQFQQTIQQKREDFRFSIRKQELEAVFKEKRFTMNLIDVTSQSIEQLLESIAQTIIQKNNQILLQELKYLSTKILVNKVMTVSLQDFQFIFNLIDNHNSYQQSIIAQVLLIIYGLTLSADIQDYEIFLGKSQILCQINYLIYNCSDFSLEIIELILFVLESIMRKSSNCLFLIVENNFTSTVRLMIDQIDIEKDEKCLLSLFCFLTVFVDQHFNQQFKQLDQIILIINSICKRLMKLNYFIIDDILVDQENFSKYELKINTIHKLLTVIKFYVDKMLNQLDLKQTKHVWSTILSINFSDKQLPMFQKITSYIILIQSHNSGPLVGKILQEDADLINNLLQSLILHQDEYGDGEKIRLNTANTLRNFMQCSNVDKQLINIDTLVNIISQEKSYKVLPYLCEIFHMIFLNNPTAKYLSFLEQWLKYGYESNNWSSLKHILACLLLVVQIDQMNSIQESQIHHYLSLLSLNGSKQVQNSALLILNEID